jgi:hypothetical protein
MQASAEPLAWGGGPLKPLETGAEPCDGNGDGAPTDADGAAPFTGGNGEAPAGAALWLGNGAGNEPCANTWPAWRLTTAAVNGTIRRRIIKGCSPARSGKPQRVRTKQICCGLFTIPADA